MFVKSIRYLLLQNVKIFMYIHESSHKCDVVLSLSLESAGKGNLGFDYIQSFEIIIILLFISTNYRGLNIKVNNRFYLII